MYKQYQLAAGESVLICWLKVDPRVKIGTLLTLNQVPDVIWTVVHTFDGVLLPTAPHQRWGVGGI